MSDTLPNDLDAEAAVLGCLLIAPEAYSQVADILEPTDFYAHRNGAIFGAAGKVATSGGTVELVTIQARLREAKSLDRVGGMEYLVELSLKMPTAASVRQYAETVLDHSLRRSLIATGERLAIDAAAPETPREASIREVEQSLLRVRQRTPTAATSAEQATAEMMTALGDRANHTGDHLGVPSGFKSVDRYTLGFQRGQLIIFGGRPSQGKSAWALQAAQYAAELGHPVLVASLEMTADALMQRLLAAETGLDCTWLRRGLPGAKGDEWARVAEAAAKLSALPLSIDDRPGRTVGEIYTRALRHGAQHGLDLLIVDHLQLLRGESRRRDLVQETTEISHDLKRLAVDLNCPVLALSQLSRESDKDNRAPRLSDLRESGSLEQDADVVLLLHRPRNDDGRTRSNAADLFLAKNRSGEQDKIIPLTFRPELVSFTERAYEDRE